MTWQRPNVIADSFNVQQSITMHLKVAPVPASESFKGHWWSLKPFLTWLKVVGIHLPVGPISFRYRLCFIFYSSLWLMMNIASNVYSLKQAVSNEFEANRETTTALSWTRVIAFCSMTFTDMAFHLGFLFVIQPKWKHLWTAIERMEAEFNCSHEFYKKCRYAVIAGLVYVIVHVKIYLIYLLSRSIFL